jgi:energy-coupling factor transporter ATP-binding protein EcfA2
MSGPEFRVDSGSAPDVIRGLRHHDQDMIQARGLTKRYGSTLAVDDLSFDVLPGRVTGFLGPNGAGKSTTMRMILGLDRPTSGTVTVLGRRFGEHYRPLHEIGAVLESRSVHGGRSAYNHSSPSTPSRARWDRGRAWGVLPVRRGGPGRRLHPDGCARRVTVRLR